MMDILTCNNCIHSTFIYETAPYGTCSKHPIIITKREEACTQFEPKEGVKDIGKDK